MTWYPVQTDVQKARLLSDKLGYADKLYSMEDVRRLKYWNNVQQKKRKLSGKTQRKPSLPEPSTYIKIIFQKLSWIVNICTIPLLWLSLATPIVCWILSAYHLFWILFIFFAFLMSSLCSWMCFLWYPDSFMFLLI